MKDKIKAIGKRILVGVLCAASMLTVAVSAIPVAEAKASKDVLGTNIALGSPILNTDNFSTEDWNKWETICWGVFLSNFCQPLIDTYETAFKENKGGSNGYGFKALWGGSGNDSANAGTIRALCDYAIDQQSKVSEPIYVGYTPIVNKELGETPTPDSKNVREATFRDLWFLLSNKCEYENCALPSGHTHSYITHVATEAIKDLWTPDTVTKELLEIANTFQFDKSEYPYVAAISSGAIPTFYVKRGSEYIKILDYTDWWDCQIMNVVCNAVRTTDELTKQFESQFQVFFDSAIPLSLDTFGNITTKTDSKNYIVIPAAANQHITKEPSINMLNSWVMNSYTQTYSNEKLQLGLRQDLQRSNMEGFRVNPNGYAAIQDSNIGNVALLYYDLDSIMVAAQRAGDITNTAQGNKFHFGDGVNALFSLDINNEKTNTFYPLKLEISGIPLEKLSWWNFFGNNANSMKEVTYANMFRNMSFAAAMIPNIAFTPGEDTKNILSEILRPDGSKIPLFTDKGICINTKSLKSLAKDEPTNQGAVRLFWSFLYDCATNDTASEGVSNKTIYTFFKGSSFSGLIKNKSFDILLNTFKKRNPLYKNAQNMNGWFEKTFDYGNNESNQIDGLRLIVAYPPSEQMVYASSVLGIKDGAEFATYCTYIYMTYLDFYGVSASKSLKDGVKYTSNFNEDIYNDLRQALMIESVGDTLANYGEGFGEQVDVQEEVAQYSLLMLHPEKGREYRKQMVENTMADWIYEQYNKTVYGGASNFSGTTSKARSGFLAIETYADNWFTSWFLANYINIVIWVIMGSIIIIVLVGLFKGKKLSWFFLSIVVIINVFLVVPSTGEIVPYVTSSMTQKMFAEKMTFWSISQGITNSTMEAEAAKQQGYLKNLTDEEKQSVLSLIKDLSMLSTDSSLSVKQDISQKITQKLASGVYSDIESYPSARWILPMVMQQFSADNADDVFDYIYKPLTYIWDDMSNMYWYFNPSDADFIHEDSPTSTSGQHGADVTWSPREGDTEDTPGSGALKIYELVSQYYPNYIDVSTKDVNEADAEVKYNYKCIAYERNNENLVHNVCYFLPGGRNVISRTDLFGTDASGYRDADSWGAYIDRSNQLLLGSKSNWLTGRQDTIKQTIDGVEVETINKDTLGFEYTADSYDRNDRVTITADMPFLWSTESPIYYFYSVIKDSFSSDIALGTVVYDLQGSTSRDENDNVIRRNFMYADIKDNETEGSTRVKSSGKLRDVLDFENMFTNMIPYLYEVSITANGFDGVSGLLTDEAGNPYKISDELQYYGGENQSWLYRCNWATKIMENPNFSEETTVADAEGNKYKITNPLLPEAYPAERPMVFSEAQKEAMGLTDADLNLVELKCIKVAKDVTKQWTLLLNYVGTAGLTKEILYRQMATDATMLFCQEFSSSGLLDTRYELYPQSLDLRYISFDSIMKMLIMNVSKDTSYIYGDTMLTVISSSDMFTAIMLMLAAWLCAFLIPLIRAALMAIIFYLGFISIIRGLFYSNKVKANIACGQIITNLIFMLFTVVYFGAFKLMMSMTSSDEMLSLNSIQAQAGSPAWVIIVVILFSIAYIVGMCWQIKFCFSNRKDMGFEQYSMLASSVVGGIQSGVGKVKDAMSNVFNRDDSEVSSGDTSTHSKSLKGSGKGAGSDSKSSHDNGGISSSGNNSGSSSKSNSSGNKSTKTDIPNGDNSGNGGDKEDILDTAATNERSNYKFNFKGDEERESTDSDDINAIIDAGNSMEDKK